MSLGLGYRIEKDMMAKKEIKRVTTEMPNATVNLLTALGIHDLGLLRSLSLCFPASIISYNRQTHEAEVLPLIKQGYYDDEWKYTERTPIKVKVRAIQHGGFTIDVPLFVGDTGWVISADRDTDLLRQDGALTNVVLEKDRVVDAMAETYPQKPNTMALHSPIHGFFIPDSWGEWEMGRWKDSPFMGLGGSMYIGQGIGTRENEKGDEEEKDENGETIPKFKPQDGERYEKETSSSLVIERHGGAHLLSSSPTEENKTARVTVKRNSVESEVVDEKNAIMISSSIDTETGMHISQVAARERTFSLDVTDIGASININGFSIYIENGKVTIDASANININTEGKVTLKSEENASFVVGDMKLFAGKDVSVNASRGIDVSSRNIMVNSTDDMSIEVDGNMLIQSGRTGGGVKLLSGEMMTIKVEELEFDKYSSKKFAIEGKEVGTIDVNAVQVDMKSNNETDGGKTEIMVTASRIEGETTNGKTKRSVNISGGKIESFGNVEVTGAKISIQNYQKGHYYETTSSKGDNALTWSEEQKRGEE